MKKSLCLAASLLALNLTPGFGQPTPANPITQPRYASPPPAAGFQQRLQSIIRNADGSPQADVPPLTKFNLDFPGGTPKELVAAIEKAMGKPLNVIIPDEDAATKLPPVKVSDMDVVRLFQTLSENGARYSDPEHNHELLRNYGFKTIDQRPSDNSLFTFYAYAKSSMLTAFDVDFPGGPPAKLVKAIEKATGKPLNVIINKEDENVELPPLKMNNVCLPQLFTALEAASRKVVAVSTSLGSPGGYSSYSQFSSGYGFKTADGPLSDDSIWYFHVEKPSMPPVVSTQKISQFYSLSPYLDRGFTVDDITTAIQTGWKMAGETATPELNYHKETKLLIAFGEPDKLKTIADVLKTLPPSSMTAPAAIEHYKMIKDLQSQIDQLKKQASTLSVPSVPPLPAEKAGK
jgi:hypothetical protein